MHLAGSVRCQRPAQSGDERPGVTMAQRCQRPAPEHRVGVQAQHPLVEGGRPRPVVLHGAPRLGVGGERLLAGLWVDVLAAVD